MTAHASDVSRGDRFEFGANWERFLSVLTKIISFKQKHLNYGRQPADFVGFQLKNRLVGGKAFGELTKFMAESRLGRTYRVIYDKLCGRHPNVRRWHFQWLDTYCLYRSLKRLLPTFGGRVLDAGCGNKPYQEWFGPVTEYVGLDVSACPAVDLVVAPNQYWPLPNEKFDVILSSQVLEHVEHLDITLDEMSRVLKRAGVAILTFPFLYNEHGVPWDYRRFTVYQAVKLFPDCEVLYLEKQVGIGSTIAILFLNWVDFI